MSRIKWKMSILLNFSGERLRRIRMARGLSGKALAELTGIAPAYLTQLEKAKRRPSVDLLTKLAVLLDTPIESFGDSGQAPPNSVREECGLYMADTPEALRAKIAALEAELAQARETIHNQAAAMAAMGRAQADAPRPAPVTPSARNAPSGGSKRTA